MDRDRDDTLLFLPVLFLYSVFNWDAARPNSGILASDATDVGQVRLAT